MVEREYRDSNVSFAIRLWAIRTLRDRRCNHDMDAIRVLLYASLFTVLRSGTDGCGPFRLLLIGFTMQVMQSGWQN